MVGYGYVEGKKGSRVYIPLTGSVVTSTNVAFSSMFHSVSTRSRDQPTLHAEVSRMLRDFDTTHLLPPAFARGGTTANPSNDTANATVNAGNDPDDGSDDVVELSDDDDDEPHQPATHSTDGDNEHSDNNGDDDLHQNPSRHEEQWSDDDHAANFNAANNEPCDPQIKKDGDSETAKPELPKGWINLPNDHPYLDRDALGRPTSSDTPATGNTIASRVRERARGKHVSDCVPGFAAMAGSAAQDLASNHKVPRHFAEAMRSPDRKHWLNAIDEELSALRKLGCYKLLSQSQVPEGGHVIGYTWVFKIKINADGSVARYKARICVDGSKQKHGIDFTETFSPVANAATIRLVIAIATHQRMLLRQFDIKLAFCAAKIDRPVYMRAPAGSGEPRTSIWKLLLSLYGLKQAPRLFNAKLHSVLSKLGWTRSKHDPCLYYANTGIGLSLLAVVVDDLLLATKEKAFADLFYARMSQEFDFKALGAPSYMIGMHLSRSSKDCRISQRQYITGIGTKHADLLQDKKPVSTPAAADLRLVKTGYSGSSPSPPVDIKLYRSLVGSLMYTVVTRPDVAVAVSMCARYLSAPTVAHLDSAVRVLRYLLHTNNLGLVYSTTPSPTLETYVDASWAADHETRRSRYGFAVFYGNALISWRSKLHQCVCLSTAEAEYVGATEAVKETMWLRHLLKDIGLEQAEPTVIHEDNAACL
jgi:hypothetical protein